MNTSDSYYNTNKECGELLANSERKAKSQEKRILEYYLNHRGCYSADYLASQVFHDRVPLTSVRRALTNLTKTGQLTKTSQMVIGRYGKQTHTWQYVPRAMRQQSLF